MAKRTYPPKPWRRRKSDTAVKSPEQERRLFSGPLLAEREGTIINQLSAIAETYEPQFAEEQLQWQLHSAAVGNVAVAGDTWLHADAIPELRQARLDADAQAASIYESHMVQLRQGSMEGVPLESDSVSAAERAWQIGQTEGKDSQSYAEARLGVQVNFQRYLAETWSKLGPEYFPPLRQTYDAEQDDYLSFGAPITPMIHRGITPLADAEEVPRRFMENRENATNNQVGALIMKLAGVEVAGDVPEVALPSEFRRKPISTLTISECPDHIISRYERDVELGRKVAYGGYAPQIKKQMFRVTTFDPETGDRFIEQVSVSGEHITHDVIVDYLELKGVISEGEAPDKTEILGLQVITDSAGGVLGVLQELDLFAGEKSGKNLFQGYEVPADHPKDYAAIPSQSAERERRQMKDADELAEYAISLAEAGVDHATGNKLIDEMVLRQMLAIAKVDNDFARLAFDDKTAETFQAADKARARGDLDIAHQLELAAEKSAPPPEGCGASCEVRSIDKKSAEGRELARLTRSKSGDSLAVDESKTRRCDCGGQLVYSYTGDRVNSACRACRKFRSVRTSVKSKD